MRVDAEFKAGHISETKYNYGLITPLRITQSESSAKTEIQYSERKKRIYVFRAREIRWCENNSFRITKSVVR